MTDSTGTVGLGEAALKGARHICVFYNSQDEEYRVLLPFIEEGFRQGDKT